MYAALSNLYPRKIKEKYRELLGYFNLKIKYEYVLGMILFFGFGGAVAIAFWLAKLFGVNFILGFLVSFIVLEVLIYSYLLLLAEKKGTFIATILPDALQLMASNLRAGMTIDKALLLSNRREFGPLNKELIRIGKEVTTGTDVSTSLLGMTKRIKSDVLAKTVDLIITGIKSGGELSKLLEQTAENLRQQRLVDEKVRTNVTIYIIFIFSAIGFGSPMLFGMSTYLVKVLINNLKSVQIPPGTGRLDLPFNITQVNIEPSFIMTFVIITIITNSILASLVLGLIRKGNERYGLTYIPVILVVALSVFFVINKALGLLFSDILGVIS